MEEISPLSVIRTAVCSRVKRRDVLVFLAAFTLTVLVHLYSFTNKFINHDDINELYGSLRSGLESGRWILGFVGNLSGRVSIPALNGLTGAFWLGLTAVFINKSLNVRHKAAAVVISLALVSYPAAVSIYSYMFTAPQYFFALFTSSAGAYLIREKKWRAKAAGAALIALGMGCYQAYFSMAAALIVAGLVLDICDRRWEDGFKPLLLEALRELGCLILALAVYFAVLRLRLWLAHTELTDYAGISGIGSLTAGQLIKRVGDAYKAFMTFPTEARFSTVHESFPWVLRLCMAAGVIAAAVRAVRIRLWRAPLTLAVLVVLIALFPLASNLVYVMAGADTVHQLMTYPMVLLWFVPALCADRMTLPEKGRLRRAAAVTVCAGAMAVSFVCGAEGAFIAGKAHLTMDLTEKTVEAFYTRIEAKIELTEGWTPGARVAFFGEYQIDSPIPDMHMQGVLTVPAALNIYSGSLVHAMFNGFSWGWTDPETRAAIEKTEGFRDMPAYPAEDSIRVIDGVVVVKLS